jgi:hypothetical protein
MALDFQHRFTLTALAWQARQTPGRLFSRRQLEACHKAAFGACACARVQGELVFRTADDVRQRHGGLRRAVEVSGQTLQKSVLAVLKKPLAHTACAMKTVRVASEGSGRTRRQGAASRCGTRGAADTPRTRRGGRGRSRCGSVTWLWRLLFAGAYSFAPHAVSALSAHQWSCGQARQGSPSRTEHDEPDGSPGQ